MLCPTHRHVRFLSPDSPKLSDFEWDTEGGEGAVPSALNALRRRLGGEITSLMARRTPPAHPPFPPPTPPNPPTNTTPPPPTPTPPPNPPQPPPPPPQPNRILTRFSFFFMVFRTFDPSHKLIVRASFYPRAPPGSSSPPGLSNFPFRFFSLVSRLTNFRTTPLFNVFVTALMSGIIRTATLPCLTPTQMRHVRRPFAKRLCCNVL